MNLNISKIQKDELSVLMQEEAFKEGWAYSEEDVNFYYHCPQNQIYAIKVGDKLAGCVILHQSSSLFHNKPIFSVGFFLVLDVYRGKKIIGPYLWEQAITAHISEDAIVCFHSVLRAVDFYDRLNYKKTPLVDFYFVLQSKDCKQQFIKETCLMFENGETISGKKHKDIHKFNNQLFPGDAGLGLQKFLQQWIQRPDAVIVGYYARNILQGYGVITVCKRLPEKLSYRISPVYAQTNEIAQTIVQGLISSISKSGFYHIELNTLAPNESEFGSFLKNIGFIQSGKNFVVCSKPKLISASASILTKVFCSIPLEYPHEVMAHMDYQSDT